MQDQGQPPLYTDAIVSIQINDADDQNPLFAQSRYWAHLPQPAQKVVSQGISCNQIFQKYAVPQHKWNNEMLKRKK